MKSLDRSSLLSTAWIAVLFTIICPSARGDPLALFTTTVTAKDSWHAAETFGPYSGAKDVVVDHDGFAYIPAWGSSAQYAAASDTVSKFAVNLLPGGEIQVGKLQSNGELEGYDNGKVAGTVTFSMTLAPIQPPPPDAPPAPSIPIFFYPDLAAECRTESATFGGYTITSTCEAEASASIGDTLNPNIPPAAGSGSLIVSGTSRATLFPTWEINSYVGDTLTITLSTGLKVAGEVFGCGVPGNTQQCGPDVGAKASVAVDPLFEFDQAAFDEEMGPNAYDLSDYYSFSFSPNIPIPTVPEPSPLLFLGTGLAGIGLAALRRPSRRRLGQLRR